MLFPRDCHTGPTSEGCQGHQGRALGSLAHFVALCGCPAALLDVALPARRLTDSAGARRPRPGPRPCPRPPRRRAPRTAPPRACGGSACQKPPLGKKEGRFSGGIDVYRFQVAPVLYLPRTVLDSDLQPLCTQNWPGRNLHNRIGTLPRLPPKTRLESSPFTCIG